jgi:hypothetical protein
MFLLYHSEGCNICEMVLHKCYVNDLYTTTCSGMLGHHTYIRAVHKYDRSVEARSLPSITNNILVMFPAPAQIDQVEKLEHPIYAIGLLFY